MKLSELMKKIEEGMPVDTCEIQVKKYLNIVDKKIIISGLYEEKDLEKLDEDMEMFTGIVNNVIIDTNGFFEVDYFLLESLCCTEICLNYTNIELDDEALEILDKNGDSFADYLYKTELYEYIKSNIDEADLERFERLLILELEQRVKNLNSTIHTVNTIKQEIINMIPSERKIKNMIKNIDKFDPKKLKTIADLTEFATKK